jgi:hypothetical protein
MKGLNIMDKEHMKALEDAIEAFWKQNGTTLSVNAQHTYVTVHPKFIVGNRINPDVAKKILSVYLSQLNSDKIVKEEIIITNNGIKMVDNGKVILDVVNEKYVDSMQNPLTDKLGHELAKRHKKSGGGTYLDGMKKQYTYGDIKEALSQFMQDAEKNDSTNMLKDAVMLLIGQ